MTFSTETFKLEALKQDDASSLNALMITNGKSFQKYLPKTLAQNLSESDSKEYILKKNKAIQTQSEFTFALKDMDTNKVAGLVILKNIDETSKQGEFAYCIGNKFSGKGWITQSIKAATKFAFEELGLQSLQIIIHKTNLSSINVAKRCGFQWTKTLENAFTPTGKNAINMELYELQYER
ncbi:GNAT family N-acetyltransferase [Formosa maritima]|uniref:GNAT family N-acetyltransferase n=1 Tax=Formosa maritima TaxID=2592046 RepID=A0A5D0G1U8_9FLAO|nr:GNAT family N-acetyltransferase [Formosa maritima]TYA52289.1 GNAT family N-acetyltransferase [Formosa maritima]